MLRLAFNFFVKVLDSCLYGFVGPFSMLVIIPQYLIYISDRYDLPFYGFPYSEIISVVLMWIGASVAIYSGALMFLFGKGSPAVTSSPQKIMQKNIYAYFRHPMMWALTLVLAGEVMYHGMLILLVWFVAWLRIQQLYVVNYEEPQLEKRFGDSYRDYCQQVPRWFPRLSKKIK